MVRQEIVNNNLTNAYEAIRSLESSVEIGSLESKLQHYNNLAITNPREYGLIARNHGTIARDVEIYNSLKNQLTSATEDLRAAVDLDDEELITESNQAVVDSVNNIGDYLLTQYLTDSETAVQITVSPFGNSNPQLVDKFVDAYAAFVREIGYDCETMQSGEDVILQIEGKFADKLFSTEEGVHKYVNKENGKQFHKTVRVQVDLIEDESNNHITENECEIQYFAGSSNGGQHANTANTNVRMTHKDTNISVVIKGRSQDMNRKTALKIINKKVSELYEGDSSKKGVLAKSERIRTYWDVRDQKLEDHRIGLAKIGEVDKFFSGDFNTLIARSAGITFDYDVFDALKRI